MGGQQGKSADDTSDEAQSRPADRDQAWPSDREPDTQSGNGDTALSRFRRWFSVRRTVNDLYQDGKHAFGFTPGDAQSYNKGLNLTENERSKPYLNQRHSDGKTPLTSLIHSNDIDGARELLLNPGVDVNYSEGQLYCGYRWDFYPPLIVAIMCKNIDMVRLLLLSEASVNVKDSEGYSALYHASKLGDSDIVSLLLSYGPDLSTPPAVTECTIRDPLQIACCHGHKNVAELLIKAGCSIHKTDENGSCLLDAALDGENEALCLFLLQKGAKISEKLFFKACQYGYVEVVRIMIDRGINARALTSQGESAIMYALNPGDLNRIKRKLTYVTDLEHTRNETYEILQRGVKLVHLLCESGCDLEVKNNMEGITSLYGSWKLQHIPAVIVLLKHGAFFELDNPCLHVEDLTDDVFDEISELYITFIEPYIPRKIFRSRKQIPRTEEVTSLQKLCRFTIRNTIKSCRKDFSSIIIRIKTLTLPPRLIDYLCYSEVNELDNRYCDILFRLAIFGLMWPL